MDLWSRIDRIQLFAFGGFHSLPLQSSTKYAARVSIPHALATLLVNHQHHPREQATSLVLMIHSISLLPSASPSPLHSTALPWSLINQSSSPQSSIHSYPVYPTPAILTPFAVHHTPIPRMPWTQRTAWQVFRYTIVHTHMLCLVTLLAHLAQSRSLLLRSSSGRQPRSPAQFAAASRVSL